MNHRDHILRARAVMEQEQQIVVGQGVVVYDAKARAWALPGGLHTTHRPAAERAARNIDRMMSGLLAGPRVAEAFRLPKSVMTA